ncbi:hypothetical protein, partial [Streptomyces sp. PSKA30]|uniref:hypothetical protein n=1 Tax=Streptomyces sp. PSKA30 TaxID=2874597 RepID=UPI001CD0656E
DDRAEQGITVMTPGHAVRFSSGEMEPGAPMLITPWCGMELREVDRVPPSGHESSQLRFPARKDAGNSSSVPGVGQEGTMLL